MRAILHLATIRLLMDALPYKSPRHLPLEASTQKPDWCLLDQSQQAQVLAENICRRPWQGCGTVKSHASRASSLSGEGDGCGPSSGSRSLCLALSAGDMRAVLMHWNSRMPLRTACRAVPLKLRRSCNPVPQFHEHQHTPEVYGGTRAVLLDKIGSGQGPHACQQCVLGAHATARDNCKRCLC